MRPLTESATARIPLASAPTPSGRMNWPGRAAVGAERAQRGAADVELVDPVAARIGDEALARGVDRDAARELHVAGLRAEGGPAGAVLVPRRRAVADDPVVGVVGDVHAAGRIDGDVVGVLQLVGLVALPHPHGPDEAPAGVEDRQAVVDVVGDDQPRLADRQALRAVQPPRRDDHDRRGAVGGEALDPVVAGVGDVDRPVRAERDPAARRRVVAAAGAEVELPGAAAAGAELALQRAVGGEAQDPVRAVDDVDRAVGGDGDAADRGQLAGAGAGRADLAPERAVGPEDLDHVRELIADVDRAVRAERGGLREAQDAARALAGDAVGGVRAGIGARARRDGDARGEQDQGSRERGDEEAHCDSQPTERDESRASY